MKRQEGQSDKLVKPQTEQHQINISMETLREAKLANVSMSNRMTASIQVCCNKKTTG